MALRCTHCGSERIYRSRFRPGERSAGNLFLSPYRCRDCKARFWRTNPSSYLVAIGAGGSLAIFSALIWIGFFADGTSWKYTPDQISADQTTANTQDQITTSSTSSPLSTAIERGDTINLQTVTQKKPQVLPDPSDNRLYTVNLFLDKAQQGDADAQYQLGILYLTGRGTLQDFSEASKWFELAAEQNHPLAQYELGLLHQIGQGVEMDYEKSYMWFNLAAAAGVEQAVRARDKAMRALSRAQLSSAQQASREWLRARNKKPSK